MIYLHRCLRICKDAREFIKSAETIYIYIYMYWTILPLYGSTSQQLFGGASRSKANKVCTG